MWAEQAARKFRAFLYSLNRLTGRGDPEVQAQRNTVEGDAAKVGLDLEDRESKGRPQQNHPAPHNHGDRAD